MDNIINFSEDLLPDLDNIVDIKYQNPQDLELDDRSVLHDGKTNSHSANQVPIIKKNTKYYIDNKALLEYMSLHRYKDKQTALEALIKFRKHEEPGLSLNSIELTDFMRRQY